jgi:hypothetical protein
MDGRWWWWTSLVKNKWRSWLQVVVLGSSAGCRDGGLGSRRCRSWGLCLKHLNPDSSSFITSNTSTLNPRVGSEPYISKPSNPLKRLQTGAHPRTKVFPTASSHLHLRYSTPNPQRPNPEPCTAAPGYTQGPKTLIMNPRILNPEPYPASKAE